MITVVHLITSLKWGGSERQLHQFIKNYDRSRFRCIVICMLNEQGFDTDVQQLGVTLYNLDMRRGQVGILGFLKLINILRKEKVDILQTWMYHANLLGLLAYKFANIRNLVWNIRCSLMEMKHYSLLTAGVVKLGGLLSFLPHAIVINSETGLKGHQGAGYRAKNWQLIPNGLDDHLFVPNRPARLQMRNQFEITEETPLIGMICRFDPMKDHPTFLKACRITLDKFPHLRILLAGTDVDLNNVELVAETKKLGIFDKILFLGAYKNIHTLLPSLDFLVSASGFGEGFPNILGEAMCCGVPCIATNVGDSANIVGDTGIIVPPRNIPALSKAIEDMLKLNEADRAKLGLLARQRIMSNFSINKMVSHYENLYSSLATN